MHDEPLPQCQVKWDEVKKHHEESIGVRTSVDKSAQQIFTLEKAHEGVMQDIRDIKNNITEIKTTLSDVKNDIKVWVLGGIVGAMIVFSLPILSLFQSIGRTEEKIYRIEKLHPYGTALTPNGEK